MTKPGIGIFKLGHRRSFIFVSSPLATVPLLAWTTRWSMSDLLCEIYYVTLLFVCVLLTGVYHLLIFYVSLDARRLS